MNNSERVAEDEDSNNEFRKLGYDRESEVAKETLLEEEVVYDEQVLFPSQKISTLGDLVDFHRKLIELCMIYELKSKATDASIHELKKWLKTGIELKEEFEEPSKILIRSVNDEIQFEKGRLAVVKDFRHLIYRTNQSLISGVLSSTTKSNRKIDYEMKDRAKGTHPNLLHDEGMGSKGWMFEYEAFMTVIEKGKAAFLTFGTYYDPNGVDIVVVDLPLTTPVTPRDGTGSNMKINVD